MTLRLRGVVIDANRDAASIQRSPGGDRRRRRTHQADRGALRSAASSTAARLPAYDCPFGWPMAGGRSTCDDGTVSSVRRDARIPVGAPHMEEDPVAELPFVDTHVHF